MSMIKNEQEGSVFYTFSQAIAILHAELEQVIDRFGLDVSTTPLHLQNVSTLDKNRMRYINTNKLDFREEHLKKLDRWLWNTYWTIKDSYYPDILQTYDSTTKIRPDHSTIVLLLQIVESRYVKIIHDLYQVIDRNLDERATYALEEYETNVNIPRLSVQLNRCLHIVAECFDALSDSLSSKLYTTDAKQHFELVSRALDYLERIKTTFITSVENLPLVEAIM